MIRCVRNAVLAIAILLGGLWGWDSSAASRGQLLARFDLARGHYEILSYGLPVSWRPDYVLLLRERYGIEDRAIAGCIVTNSLVAYADGYNAVSITAANRRYGRDIFRESMIEAASNWKSRHP
jgi:hypothetical protein